LYEADAQLLIEDMRELLRQSASDDTERGDPMTGDALRGRQVILVLIAALVIPQFVLVVLALLLVKTGPQFADWLRLGVAVVLSYLLWRGHSAARSYLAFSVFLGAVLLILGSLVLLLKTPFAIVGVLLGAAYGWAAWVLWKSPNIEAYIEAREKERNPILSLTGGDGV
jgi:hypothetical protein